MSGMHQLPVDLGRDCQCVVSVRLGLVKVALREVDAGTRDQCDKDNHQPFTADTASSSDPRAAASSPHAKAIGPETTLFVILLRD